MARYVVKIGTSVLSVDGLPNKAVFDGLVDDVADVHAAGHDVILVSSGAITWGVARTELPSDFDIANRPHRRTNREVLRKQVLAAVGQPQLMASYDSAFRRHGIATAQMLVTRHDFAEQREYDSLYSVVATLLKHRIVPIFNINGPLSCDELRQGGNDQLASMLATAFQVEKLAILTDGDAASDESHPTVVVEDTDGSWAILTDEWQSSVSGVNKANVESARLVSAFGIPVAIGSGSWRGYLRRVLHEGKDEGIAIRPRGHTLKLRKTWIALAGQSRGDIVVSSFLADRLAQHRLGSILLIGVEQVAGSFRRNDIVTVKDLQDNVLGRGEVRMSSDELRSKIDARRRGEKIEFFGAEVIHCDYFVANPSIASRDSE